MSISSLFPSLLLQLVARCSLAAGGLPGSSPRLTSASIRQLSKSERERGEPSEGDQWVHEMLAMIDNYVAQDPEEAGGERPSEEFWRMFAESDPEMSAASARLTEEIASTRLVLRRLYNLAMETRDAEALMRYTEKYGQGCTRLARLLKAEKDMQGRAADMLMQEINELILELNREFGLDLGG